MGKLERAGAGSVELAPIEYELGTQPARGRRDAEARYLRGSAMAMLALSLAATSAQAQSNEGGEERASTPAEIIVTARKREESLQQTPVAANVIGQEVLDRYVVRDIASIAQFTPGLITGESAGSVGGTITLRGVGSGESNPLIEQAVAINVDGIQVSSATILRGAQFDTKRVEVLRGPQSLFFGKNSPGGVISLISADPGKRSEFTARAGYEFKSEERYLELTASGPLTDTLGVRLAGRYAKMNGYFDTITASGPGLVPSSLSTLPRQRDILLRGTALYEPTSDFTIRLKATYTDLKQDGGPGAYQTRIACPYGASQTDVPIDDCRKDGKFFVIDMSAAQMALNALFGTKPAGFRNNKQLLLSNSISYNVEEGLSLSSVTGYYRVRERWGGALQFKPAVSIISGSHFGLTQFSQELRLTSDWDSPVNGMIGGFLEKKRIFHRNSAALPTFGLLFQDEAARQKQTALSAFGQIQWDVTEKLELSAGARYTYERKHLLSYLVGTVDVAPALPRDKVSFNNLSPELTVTYKPSSELMAFLSYKRGFKSGGFDASLTAGAILANPAAGLDFKPEKVKGFEGGIKSTLLDRTMTFNLTGYWYEFSDLQVSVLDPATVSLKILNAAQSRIRGLEAELAWWPKNISGLNIRASATYNDAIYKSFINDCYTGQTVALGCTLNFNTTSGRFTSQDLSGRQLNAAPKYTASFGIAYEFPLTGAVMLGLSSDTSYSSGFNGNPQFQPLGRQSGFAKTDATIRVFRHDRLWEIALVGRNLTNKYTIIRTFETPLTGGGKGGINDILSDLGANITRGRSVAIQASVRF